jgi:hypothetical protein
MIGYATGQCAHQIGRMAVDPGVEVRRRISFESANLDGSPQDDVKGTPRELRILGWKFESVS